jgi:hypothetical protein
MIGVTDTWFIEMAGGDEEHTFDLRVDCQVIKGSGRLGFHRIIDSSGRIMPIEDIADAEIRPSNIILKGFRSERPVQLAIKLRRTDASILFDLNIDGQPAVDKTFIGASMLQPVTMPFMEADSPEEGIDKGPPGRRPEPPYFLVWLAKSGFESRKTIELDEETKQELRALGYIQ